MPKKVVFSMVLGVFLLIGNTYAQQVFVHRDESAKPAAAPKKEPSPAAQPQIAKALPVQGTFPKAQTVKDSTSKPQVALAQPARQSSPVAPVTKTQPPKAQAAVAQSAKPQVTIVQAPKASASAAPATNLAPSGAHTAKVELTTTPSANDAAHVTAAKPQVVVAATPKPTIPPSLAATARNMRLTKVEAPARDPSNRLPIISTEVKHHFINTSLDSAFTKLADGFDFPIGKPDAQGYYKARGFRSGGHLGEDWDGIRGGDTDLGDPIYSIGDGIVVFARDCHMGWGNVIIVRHTYREGGTIKNIDALYGHLNNMSVRRGEMVARGQKIATMGTAHGLYDAHLHLEVRKNIEIGMSRAAFAKDFSNYYDPTQFILSHRHLPTGGTYRVALNTFVRDSKINFDKARNYSHARSGGGSRESAAALKKAIAKKN